MTDEQQPAFLPGSVVRLKSGGPHMTVIRYMPEATEMDNGEPFDHVMCIWMDDSGAPHKVPLPVVALEHLVTGKSVATMVSDVLQAEGLECIHCGLSPADHQGDMCMTGDKVHYRKAER